MRSKRWVILYAVLIFAVVLFITFNSVCTVRQVEVHYKVGSAVMEEQTKKIQNALDEKYLNKSFLFFKTGSVQETVSKESEGYLEVLSVEKDFPNHIKVEIRERYENFAFKRDGKYYVVGDDGTVLAIKEENKNNIAGVNIEIEGIVFAEPQIGDRFHVGAEYEDAYSALKLFFETLSEYGYRGNISKIRYSTTGASDPAHNFSYFYADTVEGVHLWMVNPEEKTQEKINAALGVYAKLGIAERMQGYIFVNSEGAKYSTNKPLTAE